MKNNEEHKLRSQNLIKKVNGEWEEGLSCDVNQLLRSILEQVLQMKSHTCSPQWT